MEDILVWGFGDGEGIFSDGWANWVWLEGAYLGYWTAARWVCLRTWMSLNIFSREC